LTLVSDHYVAEEQQNEQRPVAFATMSGEGGHRTVSTFTPGDSYCSDVISVSQVEQLMDSLQHIVATDNDDNEVQMVNLAVQQRRGRRGRRQDSPSYAEPALERRMMSGQVRSVMQQFHNRRFQWWSRRYHRQRSRAALL